MFQEISDDFNTAAIKIVDRSLQAATGEEGVRIEERIKELIMKALIGNFEINHEDLSVALGSTIREQSGRAYKLLHSDDPGDVKTGAAIAQELCEMMDELREISSHVSKAKNIKPLSEWMLRVDLILGNPFEISQLGEIQNLLVEGREYIKPVDTIPEAEKYKRNVALVRFNLEGIAKTDSAYISSLKIINQIQSALNVVGPSSGDENYKPYWNTPFEPLKLGEAVLETMRSAVRQWEDLQARAEAQDIIDLAQLALIQALLNKLKSDSVIMSDDSTLITRDIIPVMKGGIDTAEYLARKFTSQEDVRGFRAYRDLWMTLDTFHSFEQNEAYDLSARFLTPERIDLEIAAREKVLENAKENELMYALLPGTPEAMLHIAIRQYGDTRLNKDLISFAEKLIAIGKKAIQKLELDPGSNVVTYYEELDGLLMQAQLR